MSLLQRELQAGDAHLVVDELVEEGDNVVTLDSDQDEAGVRLAVHGRKRSSGGARVDEVLAVVLLNLLLVRMPADQDVTVELPLVSCECFHVTPGDYLVPVDESDLKIADFYDLGL